MLESPQILLVEQEQSIIDHVSELIEKIGFNKPQVANSREEARKMAGNNRPDIALVDLSMETKNGGQNTAHMLRDEYHLPVVYLATREEENAHSGGEAPYGYVFKPVDRRNLKKTILLALSRHSQLDNFSFLIADLPIPTILIDTETLEILICNPVFSTLFPFIHNQDKLSDLNNSKANIAGTMIEAVRQVKIEKKPVVVLSVLHTTIGEKTFKITAKPMESMDHPAVALTFAQTETPEDELFAYSPIMQMQMDVKGTIMRANRKWLEKTGYTLNEILHQSFISLLPSESAKTFQNTVLSSLDSEAKTNEQVLEIRLQNGETPVFQTRFSVLPGNSSFLAAFMDYSAVPETLKEKEDETNLANALRDSAEALTSTLNFDEVLDRILVNVGEVVPNEAANVMMIWSGVAYIVRSIGYAERGLEESMMSLQIPISQESHFLSMYETGMPLAVGDIREYAALESHTEIQWARSMASAPLRSKGQVFGFLNLESSQPGYYDQKHADRLQAFADQAAVAIENARLYAEVQQYAITDELTDIYNRRGLFELGRREVERARRYGRSLSAVMIDTDKFKEINDNYSHSVGDHVLRVMAERWKASIREVDILGRYGGDEFVVLLPETDIDSAMPVADRLRMAICGKKIETPVGDLELTVSIGVAEISETVTSFDLLIEQADQAMFHSKAGGKNQVSR